MALININVNDIVTLQDVLKKQYSIGQTPTYQAMRCSDRKSGGEDCTVCHDVCPMNIYPEGKRKRPIYTECLKCGICVANCPDRCIAPPAARVDNFLMAVSKSGETGICCAEDSTNVMTLSVGCIAALSWEQMAYAALNTGLAISLAHCDNCDKDNFKALIADNLAQLRFFLGDELFEKRVKILKAGDKYTAEDTGMSRRDLFKVFKNMPLDKAMRSLPEIPAVHDNGLFYRALLRDEVARYSADMEQKDKPRYRVKLPVFTDNCYNCGSCARLCPQKALKLVNDGDKILVAVEAWRCVGCGICMNTCKSEGISSIGTMKLTTLGKVALKRIQAYPCEDCGKPRPRDAEENCCSICLNKRKSARQRAEREAKRAAEKAAKEAEEAAKKAAEEAAAAEAAVAEAVPAEVAPAENA